MVLRRLIVPVAIAIGLLTVPTSAQAADPIPVTVKVVGAQTYGGQPAFVGSTGVAGLTVTGVTCTGLTSGVPISPTLKALGSYAIAGATCSGGTLSNPGYTIAGYTGGAHAVYRAPLKVTAENRSKLFAAPNPTLGYAITGYVNGQDSSVVTGEPVLSTTATTSSDTGTYPITVAAGTLAVPSNNYYFTYVAGTLTVAPRPVAVTVGGVQNYGDQPVFSGKTAVTGLTVSGVSCTGVLSGEAIAPTLPAGSYAVDPATCDGGVLSSTNYAIGSYKSASFVVFKAALTVTASDRTRTYGAANPALGYTITGFQNGDDASEVSGSPALATSATTSSDVGSYPITATVGTLASSNYRFIYVPGTLSVTPKPVNVTVNGAQNYGDQPAFAAKTAVAGLTVSGVSCAGVLSGESIAPTLPAGSYAVDPATCSGGVLSSTNYEIGSYKSASYLVYKAPLAVTATDASRVYGFANPSLDYTITGFQNGEDASDLSGTPTLSTTAVVKSNAGTYPIDVTAGSLSSANYRFVFRPGTLTVTKRQLLVAADPATRSFGGDPPAYTATFTGFRNGDTAASLTGAPAFSTPATASSEPGSYPLHVAEGSLASPNYSFGGFVSSTLTITTGVADIATTKLAAGVLSATITFGTSHTPVVGSTITFTIGNGDKLACTAVTDATGRAACTVSGSTKLAIQLNGYTAHFPGTAFLLPGEKHQGIV